MEVDSDDEYDTPETRAEAAAFSGMDSNILDQLYFTNTLGIKPGYIQPGHSDNKPLPTCVFDDIFHVETHLLRLLPKGLSAFKPFSQALSQVILVEDVDDCRCVEAVLAKQNQT